MVTLCSSICLVGESAATLEFAALLPHDRLGIGICLW